MLILLGARLNCERTTSQLESAALVGGGEAEINGSGTTRAMAPVPSIAPVRTIKFRRFMLPPELSLGVLSGSEVRITLGGYTWGILCAIPVVDSVVCSNCGRGDRALRNHGPQDDTQMFSFAESPLV